MHGLPLPAAHGQLPSWLVKEHKHAVGGETWEILIPVARSEPVEVLHE